MANEYLETEVQPFENNAGEDRKVTSNQSDPPQEKRVLPPAAQRALAEAEERRREAIKAQKEQAKELGGREGPDPVRYGDWENDGIASDF